jgi:hypothetical protein
VLTLLFLPALCSLVLGRERTKTTETSHATPG